MARVNEAYARGDQPAIEAMIAEEQSRPEAISGDDVAARLVRVLRQIAQVRRRLDELTALEAGLREDPLWRLYEVVIAARDDGRDRLAELEADIRSRIASAQARLAALSLASSQSRAVDRHSAVMPALKRPRAAMASASAHAFHSGPLGPWAPCRARGRTWRPSVHVRCVWRLMRERHRSQHATA